MSRLIAAFFVCRGQKCELNYEWGDETVSTIVPAMRLSVFHVTEFEIVAYFIIFCLILLETGLRALFRLAESCAGEVLSFIAADRVAVFTSTIHVVRVTNLLCSPVILLILN